MPLMDSRLEDGGLVNIADDFALDSGWFYHRMLSRISPPRDGGRWIEEPGSPNSSVPRGSALLPSAHSLSFVFASGRGASPPAQRFIPGLMKMEDGGKKEEKRNTKAPRHQEGENVPYD
jgi:hypothetical protein